MNAESAAQAAELRHGGWTFSATELSLIAEHPRHGMVVVRNKDPWPAVLAACWVLVGNPWGGNHPGPAGRESVKRSRGTNPRYPGHGKQVDP